jgi:hypothetical protein
MTCVSLIARSAVFRRLAGGSVHLSELLILLRVEVSRCVIGVLQIHI